MHHVTKLKKENDQLRLTIALLRGGCNALIEHCQSSKFTNDTTIQTGDVIRRIEQDILSMPKITIDGERIAIVEDYNAGTFLELKGRIDFKNETETVIRFDGFAGVSFKGRAAIDSMPSSGYYGITHVPSEGLMTFRITVMDGYYSGLIY